MQRASSVDHYIDLKPEWAEELLLLRKLFLLTSLEETVKWGMPVYTAGRKNVAGFSAFKSHVAIWFYQGVFLKDRANHLVSSHESTKGLRQWRFGNALEIAQNEIEIVKYLEEAIENQKKGMEIQIERKKEFQIHPDLQSLLAKDSNLKLNFNQLPPYKQREYAEYVSGAKREETRQNRLEKIAPLIRQGIGLNDRYKSK